MTVTPLAFGAIGDGVVDDTVAVTAALATFDQVDLPAGRIFKTTAQLQVTGIFQRFGGPGILRPVGTFDAVRVTGGQDGVELDLTVDGAGHTGDAVLIDGAHRTRVKKLHLINGGYSGITVQGANHTSIEWFFAPALRGPHGVRWYGSASLRSDILIIDRATCSFVSGNYGTGLEWDGNCNSLTVFNMGVVNGGYGLRVHNSSGGPDPAIGRFFDFESDYPHYDAARIEVGADYDLVGSYLQGSATGSGLFVGSSVTAGQVRVQAGKSLGNARYGIETSNEVYACNLFMASNTMGNVLGTAAVAASRIELDSSAYYQLQGGNPLLAYDANDYTAYDRASNLLVDYIGGAAVLGRGLNGTTAYKPVIFTPGSTAPSLTNGQVSMELTTNSTLKFKARGTDGILRSASMVLS